MSKSMRTRAACTAAVSAVAALLLLSACGGSGPHGSLVRVTERDFRIVVPRVLPHGDIRFLVANRGPVAHELLLVRLAGRTLPLRSDGFTIDEEALRRRLVASIEPQQPGHERELDVRLRRGHYVVLCNMAGHAAGGMLTTFTVR